jgi:hypothetical protein
MKAAPAMTSPSDATKTDSIAVSPARAATGRYTSASHATPSTTPAPRPTASAGSRASPHDPTPTAETKAVNV